MEQFGGRLAMIFELWSVVKERKKEEEIERAEKSPLCIGSPRIAEFATALTAHNVGQRVPSF